MSEHVCSVPSPQVRIKILGDDEPAVWIAHDNPLFRFLDKDTGMVWAVRLEYIGVQDRVIEGVRHAER